MLNIIILISYIKIILLLLKLFIKIWSLLQLVSIKIRTYFINNSIKKRLKISLYFALFVKNLKLFL